MLPAARPAYRADVDGLRAVAVVSVLLFHAGWSAFSGGFTGVDVFFVISGYVISLSLFRDLDSNTFSLAGFYARRARRILPALTAVLLGTLLASLWLVPPVYFRPFAGSLVAASLFFSNVHFWQDSSYFNSDSPFRPLLHTWSLGVEEQYYLVIPVFLLLIRRWLGGRWRAATAVCLAASFALCLLAVDHGHVDAAFFLAPTRAWEFLLGVMVALVPATGLPRWVREAGTLAGLAMIMAAVFLYGPATVFPGVSALLPCVGTAMVIHFGAAPVLVSRLLAAGPFVWTGRVSYSLYLVHWPVLVLAPFVLMRRLDFAETVLALAACFVLSALLFTYVETPARKAGARTGTALVLGVALACILGTAAAGKLGQGLNGHVFDGRTGYGQVPDFGRVEQAWGAGKCLLVGGQPVSAWTPDACRIGGAGEGDEILLFGDSFAAHYVPGLKVNADRLQAPILPYAMEGCPPALSAGSPGDAACRAFRENVVNIVRGRKISRVVVAGSWIEYGEANAARVEGTLVALKQAGAEVILIGQPPNFYLSPYLIEARMGTGDAPDVTLPLSAEAKRMNALLAGIAQRTGVAFIDPAAALCPDGICPVRTGGAELFLDYGHFTPDGAAVAARAYFPFMDR